jgi:transposase
MKVHEVILQAMAKKLRWLEAADVLGMRPRTLRRWKWKLERFGLASLVDRRRKAPSPRRVPGSEVERIVTLYRERYPEFNVRHFHKLVRRDHGVTQSYSFVKQVLQGAGLVRKQRARGKHRVRRARRPCVGEMLHLDGSRHHWLALEPTQWQSLITVVDDATSRLLYAQLWPGESRVGVMHALRTVFLEHGLPQQLYTDRAAWAAHTPRAGGKPDDGKPTQIQRALEELGIEHLRAYSPQARGRSERTNRTLQGRLVNELRARGIRTREAANHFLREAYYREYNDEFAQPAADPAAGFVPVGAIDLDQFLCFRAPRTVGRDNTVVLGPTVLQIPKQPGRRSCQGLRVIVRQHLDGRFTVSAGPRRLALYDPHGRLVSPDSPVTSPRDRRSPGILRSRFHARTTKPSPRRASRPSRSVGPNRPDHLSKPSGQFTC